MRILVLSLVVLILGFGTTIVIACGTTGLLYAVIYSIAVAPGLALGWALFGRRHAAAWIGGALLGYGFTQLSLWLPIALDWASTAAFLLVWAIVSVLQLAIAVRIKAPLVPLPEWTRKDARALVLVMLLAPGLMLAPYRNLAAFDNDGARYYRAYFTADFFWHAALVGELGKYSMPPRNPYMASRAMNYYWTYFLLPAVVAKSGPSPLRDVQTAVKANAICSALLLFGAVFLLVRLAVRSPYTAATASALGIVAPSAEGSWVLQQLVRSGAPLSSVTVMNIDAITAWQFQGLRIDNLARSIWYNAQHSMACALGLLALVIAARGASRSPAVALLAGTALAFSTCLNPFVGGVFSLIYGVALAWQTIAASRDWRGLAVQGLAAGPVLLALAWCARNRVFAGAGTAVTFGFSRTDNPITTLLLSMGTILVPALVGAWPFRELDRQPARVALTGTAIALWMLYFVTLSESSWVGFRAGQILLLLLPVLLARTFDVLIGSHRAPVVALAALILIIGLPTTVIDVYNAQDISNRRQGPGFRWTLLVTARQQEAFRWIQRATPEDAIVQMEPVVRGREHWSLIPSFAQRRMAAGLPISLLPTPEYERSSEQVRNIFAATDPRAARDTARRLRIDYLYVDETDRRAYADGTRKFAEHGEYFGKLFDNGEVSIFAVY